MWNNKKYIFFTLLISNFVYASDLGQIEGDFKSFYFSGDRENRQDREALAVGGILKYTTPNVYNFSASLALYSSNDILKKESSPTSRIADNKLIIDNSNIAGNTELVNSDGTSINTLGEAYINYKISNTSLQVGRQRLDTPMVNDYYNRFLPNSFEAISLVNTDLKDTLLQTAVINRWKYKASDEFKDISNGFNEKLYLVGVKNNSIDKLYVQAWYYKLNNLLDSFYTDLHYKQFPLIGDTTVDFFFQYLKQNDCGSSKIGNLNTYVIGTKAVLNKNNLKFAVMYDKVGDDTIRASGNDYANLGISKFINYTDIQIDGEALNAGAQSYGGYIEYNSNLNYNISLKYIHIDQNNAKQIASTTPNKRPDSNEYNIDMSYKNKTYGKFRVRIAKIDYATDSAITNEYDELNIRFIYDYVFKIDL